MSNIKYVIFHQKICNPDTKEENLDLKGRKQTPEHGYKHMKGQQTLEGEIESEYTTTL